MTSHKVVKMPVQECDQLTTCQECHRDPFCGWCLLENKCSTKRSCSESDAPRRWQSYSDGAACAGITRVTPANSSLTSPVEVTLTVPNLPTAPQNYTCLFGDIETSASVEGDRVICQPPATDAVTKQPHNHTWDHVALRLTLRSSETMVSFLQTGFNFYNCSRHDSCISCTRALWGCNWCVHENKCTKKNSCDNTDTAVHVSHSCPHLEGNDKEILLPAEFQKEVYLKGANLPEPRSGDGGYKCLVHLTTPPLRVDATRLNSTSVKCKATKVTTCSITNTFKWCLLHV
ncbi:hypothetical protein NP493_894g00029 [Ridgeia piscesae]|uniref:PSI domain-containing protein n=1 Tax=Ridgeia piscesae TaxID=27915 RepID=A0AAD9KMK3_RIDPI|nr:hypothetical protein NP493_894g00029 [Ridgeia piscesae]